MSSTRSLLCAGLVGYLSTASALYTNLTGNYHMDSAASYSIRDSYTASNFFSNFNFFTGSDPTHGYVSYQSQGSAQSSGLINSNNNQIYMGVDSSSHLDPNGAGRASVRVASNKAYTHGLFIADIQHMPASVCGVWPAFWMFGPNWPGSGEIDIIEGVNQQTTNSITLHTASGCSINTAGSQGGTALQNSNCNANNANTGCGVSTQAPYGNTFNANGGGVYAMQWESSGIYVWFFARNNIPGDIQSGNPQTGNWGAPVVSFNGGSGCNIDSYFKNQNILFDTTFCGDWAGAVWGSSGCASQASSCNSYVAGNPGAFAPAYWSINSVKVYQL